MPALTRNRLDEIRSVASVMVDAMSRGAGSEVLGLVPEVASAIDDVNASLAEVDDMLVAGLRAEATSMHDAELVTVARLLDIRSRPGWVAVHGWLLERGQLPPATVCVDRAEQFAAAIEDGASGEEDVAKLRLLALERAPVAERLAILRRLRTADPANRAWVDAVSAHEDARIRELRVDVPRALAEQDIEAIAVFAEELADPGWDRRPPADLEPMTAGAAAAREIAAAVAEARGIAAEIARLPQDGAAVSDREIDALAAHRQRILALRDRVDENMQSLADHPRMLEVVKARGFDVAVHRDATEVSANLERIDRLAAKLKTRRDFAMACQRLDHLCNHPPGKGDEGRWLADLQRSEFVARAACQELPELAMPALLRERVVRAAAAIESVEQLRRRFYVIMSAVAVIVLVAITGTVGWLSWRRGEYDRMIDELERRVAEARAGLHLERPSVLDGFAGPYAGDARVSELVENFEAGVAAEKTRVNAFKRHLADHGEHLEDLAVDVDERRAAGEDCWLQAWPPSFAAAAATLAAARRSGGLPDRRGGTAPSIPPSTQAMQRFLGEEEELAEAEERQAHLNRSLEELARRAFDARLERIQDGVADADPTRAERLRADLRALRGDAVAARVEGVAADIGGGPRLPPEAVDTLEALEIRLRDLGRRAKEQRGDDP